MSGRPNKEDEDKKSSGSGLVASVMVAGGAAAIGFMASKLWDAYKNQQEQPYSSGQCSRSSSSSSWTPRSRMESRKQTKGGGNSEVVPQGQTCVVCFDNPREVLLEPCNHVILCENCAERFNVDSCCPICRVKITGKKEVYL